MPPEFPYYIIPDEKPKNPFQIPVYDEPPGELIDQPEPTERKDDIDSPEIDEESDNDPTEKHVNIVINGPDPREDDQIWNNVDDRTS